VVDTLKLVLLLFLTYLLMEFIEHRASDKVKSAMTRAGSLGPMVGGVLGAVPQCGFSAAAANLYTGRVITLGTLIAVFLSTSDEMLPIMLSGGMKPADIGIILIYKCAVAVLVGFSADLLLKLLRRGKEEINIDAICEEDECHCERGIFYSALHHTLTISAFVLLFTVAINALMHFLGTDFVTSLLYDKPILGHAVAAVFGLIPNCAASVALTSFFAEGVITAGTMMSGLFSGAGVGLLVLFRVNRPMKENLIIIAALVAVGMLFGFIFDVAFASLLA
jgi:hypothetical protein